jgi:hypothetical protein
MQKRDRGEGCAALALYKPLREPVQPGLEGASTSHPCGEVSRPAHRPIKQAERSMSRRQSLTTHCNERLAGGSGSIWIQLDKPCLARVYLFCDLDLVDPDSMRRGQKTLRRSQFLL